MRKRKRHLRDIKASGKPHIHRMWQEGNRRRYVLTSPKGNRLGIQFGGPYGYVEKNWFAAIANAEAWLCREP